MRLQPIVCSAIAVVIAWAASAARAGDDKGHEISKDGVTIHGKVAADSPKVKLIFGDKFDLLPAKLFEVRLLAGKKYRITMDSKDVDGFLIVQDKDGRKLAWDDDSGGDLNSLITLDVLKKAAYKIHAASLKGAGSFTLKVQEDGATKIYQVGPGLKLNGELGKVQTITYKIKLDAGKTYVIDMMSLDPSALDPFLRLLDAESKQLAEDDDEGGALNARITCKIERAGIHQVVATSFGKGNGPFTLTVREAHDGDRVLTRDDLKKLDNAHQLSARAAALHTASKVTEAIKATQEVLAIRKAILGEKSADYAASLNSLALLYEAQGNYAKAEPLCREALDIVKEVLGDKHAYYAAFQDTLAVVYRSQGNDVKAEPLFRHVLDLRKAGVGEKHPGYAQSLNNLANLYALQRNFAKAEPLYLQALDIQKEVLGEKNSDYAKILTNLAVLYHSLGSYAKAEPLYRQGLDIRKEVLGEKHPAYAWNLNNLALVYYSHGNYAKAESLVRQALDIRREVLGEKHADFATSLNDLGLVYHSQGNDAKAESLIRQALEIYKQAVGEKHQYYSYSLHSLAVVYYSQGNYEKAEALCHLALEIYKETLGEKHPDYAMCLADLAHVYNAQGNYAKAEPLHRQAIDVRKAVLGEKHPNYAWSLHNLGVLYHAQKNYAKAELLYQQALVASQVSQRTVPVGRLNAKDLRVHPNTVWILQNHGRSMLGAAGTGNSRDKLRSSDRSFVLALEVLERLRQENIDQQQDKIHLAAEKFDLFPERISVLHKLFALEKTPEDLEAAFSTAEQGTARSFLESLGKNRVNRLAGVNSDLQTQENELLHEIHLVDLRLEKELSRTLEMRNPELIGQLLDQRKDAEAKMTKLIVQMEKDHPQYTGLKYPRPCKLEDARTCLARDVVALLFVPGTEESFVVLVDARPKPGDNANGLAIIELPGAATLAELVASLTDTETLGLPARARLLGRQAFDSILGPCKERIKDKSLVIVPNGSLCFLPFEMLVEEDGKYLVEKHRIRYAPSLTALHLINLWKQKRAQPEVPLFAVGDPLYEVGENVAAAGYSDALRELLWREGKPGKFKRLVHSSTEIAEIAKLLGAKSEYLMTGEDASEAKVKAASAAEKMAKARYVHFATHGILGVDKDKQPALVLNLVGNSGEDGFLEYEEILNLKLNADLVVLSACRTGQGRMARGEGVTGLARAFLYAGSKGVVCSLWSVDDRETANLMVDFYGHLQKGRPAADALRESQLRMISEGKAPLYWAPFILIGE